MSLQPFRHLLDAGFPREHIIVEVERHLDALRALPDDTQDCASAITETRTFLAELNALPPVS